MSSIIGIIYIINKTNKFTKKKVKYIIIYIFKIKEKSNSYIVYCRLIKKFLIEKKKNVLVFIF